jgi:hypothetical protein
VQVILREMHLKRATREVDLDLIPFLKKSQRPAESGFGANVADARTSCSPRKAAVGEHRHRT